MTKAIKCCLMINASQSMQITQVSSMLYAEESTSNDKLISNNICSGQVLIF